MTGVWTYPWTLYEEGLEQAFGNLADRGIDKLAVATHHHSARVLQPRLPDALFERRPAGCYFRPDGDRFEGTPIRPIQNEVADAADPLAEIVEVASDYGLRVNAWTVCFHNSRLGAEYPTYRVEDCFGTPNEHAFCPSHPEVRRYFAGVTAEVADRGVGAVELESVGFPNVFHGHDTVYGHDARQVLTTDTEEWLLSQCFCDACRREADDHPVEVDRAQAAVQELIETSFREPHSDPPSLSDLARERPVLRDLFEFRAAVVDELFERIAGAAGDVDVKPYVRQAVPDWPAGRTFDSLERHADRVTALCYVSDPTVARERIRTLRRSTNLPIDAGVTLDPSTVESARGLATLVDAIRAEIDGRVSVYNHAMMTESQLDWVGAIAD